jgi:glycosyltransferase involved in cell wall biosynthesis
MNNPAIGNTAVQEGGTNLLCLGATVSIIVPCRNEVAFISDFLNNLRIQQTGPYSYEFLIADGMSNDGTREILEGLSKEDKRFCIIDNPEGYVSTGLNRAIRAAQGEVVVRMDVHTHYQSDYVLRCVCALEETGAANVGGPWRAQGHTFWERAIAAAFQCAFGCGWAASHKTGYSGPVDTVYLGCWRKATLLSAGLFDEQLVRNQDDELNFRLKQQGALIWQDHRICSYYRPRGSLFSLFKQYAQYGYWKAMVFVKYGQPAALRHLVPLAFFLFAVLSPILLVTPLAFLAVLGWGSYLGLSVWSALRLAAGGRQMALVFVLPLIFAVMHLAYGFGCARGLLTCALRRRAPGYFTTLSRGA